MNAIKRLPAGVPVWLLIGAVAVLLPIFAIMTQKTVERQKAQSIRLLLEKGAALIRSVEAGTRTGMMGGGAGSFQLQNLLTETARQPDIAYLLVTDSHGSVLAHNDPAGIGASHGQGLDLKAVAGSGELRWHKITGSDGTAIFEVFRTFSPAHGGHMGGRMGMHHGRMMRGWGKPTSETGPGVAAGDRVIFVGLDMTVVENVRRLDTRNTIITGLVLLLVGVAGISLLFLAQGYRSTRAALSRVQAFSDHLVERMPMGLVALDDSGAIASINRAAASVLAMDPNAVTGKAAADVLPPPLWSAIDGLKPPRDVLEQEVSCRIGTDRSVLLGVTMSRMRGDSGSVPGSILLLKDLTEVRALREEIARSQRLATVGSLAAGVAHEIRNPLSSIKGFATYFRERYRKTPEDHQIATILIQEVDRLNRVVGQLLELARPVTISKSPESLKPLIEDTVKVIEPQAREKGINVHASVSTDNLTVPLDPDRIRQVLLNLFLNALEAMDSGGRLGIAAGPRADGQGVELTISDTGAGIAPSHLERIFDPYFTTKPSGTGLGLAIVHTIIEAHRGEIAVDSRPDGGTVFTVFFPFADKDNSNDSESNHPGR